MQMKLLLADPTRAKENERMESMSGLKEREQIVKARLKELES